MLDTKICVLCKNEFKVRSYRKNFAKYCSYKCYWADMKTKPKYKKQIRKLCEFNVGRIVSIETRKKMGLAQSLAHKNKKHPPFSEETKKRIGLAHKGKKLSEETKKKMSISKKGEKNWSWRGGITPLYEIIRNSFENKQWSKAILARDNYTCQKCGDDKGRNLEAHHKKSFACILKTFLKKYNQFSPMEDKETLARLAIKYQPFWNIDNGVTLCSGCHRKIKTFDKLKAK